MDAGGFGVAHVVLHVLGGGVNAVLEDVFSP